MGFGIDEHVVGGFRTGEVGADVVEVPTEHRSLGYVGRYLTALVALAEDVDVSFDQMDLGEANPGEFAHPYAGAEERDHGHVADRSTWVPFGLVGGVLQQGHGFGLGVVLRGPSKAFGSLECFGRVERQSMSVDEIGVEGPKGVDGGVAGGRGDATLAFVSDEVLQVGQISGTESINTADVRIRSYQVAVGVSEVAGVGGDRGNRTSLGVAKTIV